MNIIIKRNLKDYASWKNQLADVEGMRKGYGSKGLTVYQNAKDLNEVYLVVEWDDDKPYMGYLDHPDVRKALAETGTTEIIEVKETFSLDS